MRSRSKEWSFWSWSRELSCRSWSRGIETFGLVLVDDSYTVVKFGGRSCWSGGRDLMVVLGEAC
jgi:hypothetical protein